MPRPAGSRNADHGQRRRALAEAVVPVVLSAGLERLSLRELARAADVQPNTLRHYFGDRDGVVDAAFAVLAARGAPWQAWARSLSARAPADGLRELLHTVARAWVRGGLGGLQAAGLAEGLGHGQIGPTYVSRVLEPSLQALEALLAEWQRQGRLGDGDPRHGALVLFSPMLVTLLHQRELGGALCRPLDLDAFVESHVTGFLAGWASAGHGR